MQNTIHKEDKDKNIYPKHFIHLIRWLTSNWRQFSSKYAFKGQNYTDLKGNHCKQFDVCVNKIHEKQSRKVNPEYDERD